MGLRREKIGMLWIQRSPSVNHLANALCALITRSISLDSTIEEREDLIWFDMKMAISSIFPLASLIPIETIMFTCRTATHLQNPHRSTGMRCLQVSLQFPIRMLLQSTMQEASFSLINCLGKTTSLNFATSICQLLCQRATHTCQHNYNGVVFMCPLLPQGSNERETLRQFVHFLPQLLHASGLRHQNVESSSALIDQGKWRQVCRMALARASNLQVKHEKNPSTARQRSATEKAKYDHKCATATSPRLAR